MGWRLPSSLLDQLPVIALDFGYWKISCLLTQLQQSLHRRWYSYKLHLWMELQIFDCCNERALLRTRSGNMLDWTWPVKWILTPIGEWKRLDYWFVLKVRVVESEEGFRASPDECFPAHALFERTTISKQGKSVWIHDMKTLWIDELASHQKRREWIKKQDDEEDLALKGKQDKRQSKRYGKNE